jgi:hypothetical protein
VPLPALGNFLSDESVSSPQGEAALADLFLKPLKKSDHHQ